MYNKVRFVAYLLVFLVLTGAGCAKGASILSPTDQSVPKADKSDMASSKLDLNITTPKNTYKVNEKFSGGKYLLNYTGSPFKAVVLYGRSRKGFEDNTNYSVAVGMIKTGDFDSNPGLDMVMQAFKMNKNGFGYSKDFFTEPGEYIFTMSVYGCSDLGLGDDCSADVSAEYYLKFKPVGTISKTITVVADVTAPSDAAASDKEVFKGTVLDCPSAADDPQCSLKFVDLFSKNLKSCLISKGTTPIGLEPLMGIYRGYDILGIQNNLCVVNFWFLKTKDIPVALLNKQMTCKYGATERTIDKVAKVENCEGPLEVEIKKVQ